MDEPHPMDDSRIRRSARPKALRQCTAKSKRSGQRCKRAPIRGGNVCSMHGGKAPQVEGSARERLASLVDPAIVALRKALEADDLNATLRAARLVLDRTGYGPTKTIVGDGATTPMSFTLNLDKPVTKITRTIVDPADRFLRWVPADRIAAMRKWMAEAMTAEAEKRPPLHDDIPSLTDKD